MALYKCLSCRFLALKCSYPPQNTAFPSAWENSSPWFILCIVLCGGESVSFGVKGGDIHLQTSHFSWKTPYNHLCVQVLYMCVYIYVSVCACTHRCLRSKNNWKIHITLIECLHINLSQVVNDSRNRWHRHISYLLRQKIKSSLNPHPGSARKSHALSRSVFPTWEDSEKAYK